MKGAKGGFLTIALFALAATLLTFSVVGSSQAALTYFSDTYGAEVSMQDIGVTLVENGNENKISNRDYTGSNDVWNEKTGALLLNMLGTGDTKEDTKLGKVYTEELAVTNSGTIDEYVRVTIYKYWADNVRKDSSGYIVSAHKRPDLDPGLIELELALGNGWREDTASRTDERTVLYYDPILDAGDTTPAFSSTLTLDAMSIEQSVTSRTVTTRADGSRVIETTYTYDGKQFVLEVNVDAVQTHNPEAAKMSAWGTLG